MWEYDHTKEDVERRILIDEIKAIKEKSRLEKKHYLKRQFRKMLKGKAARKRKVETLHAINDIRKLSSLKPSLTVSYGLKYLT